MKNPQELITLTQAQLHEIHEEIANSVTHGIGVGLSIAALIGMLAVSIRSGEPRKIVGASIFGGTMILIYLASTLYHSVTNQRVKAFFHRVDLIAITMFIAGSYTPFLLVSLWGNRGVQFLIIIWTIAVFNIVMGMFFFNRLRWLTTGAYLVMGWLVVAAFGPLRDSLPPAAIAWLVAGGISYTIGVLFFVWDKLPFNHAIWHLWVMGGTVCHFLAVWLYVLPHSA